MSYRQEVRKEGCMGDMIKAGFCEKKFRSMLLTGTLTTAVLYIMLLCDNIVAGFFVGEKGVAAINAVTPVTGLTILEKNVTRKKPILIELSLLFEDSSALLIERDSGEILDLTDPDQAVSGLSSFTLSGLMESQKEKAYLTTTGYNRNMIRFSCTR